MPWSTTGTTNTLVVGRHSCAWLPNPTSKTRPELAPPVSGTSELLDVIKLSARMKHRRIRLQRHNLAPRLKLVLRRAGATKVKQSLQRRMPGRGSNRLNRATLFTQKTISQAVTGKRLVTCTNPLGSCTDSSRVHSRFNKRGREEERRG
jgi:hypothetical protein